LEIDNETLARDYFKVKFEKEKDAIIETIGKLVAVPSVRDEKSAKVNSPFGMEIRNAFDVVISIAEALGLAWKDYDGYALHVEIGEGDETVGILAHADVVGAGDRSLWDTDPYTATVSGGQIYGRGVNDDKAAIAGLLHILKFIKESGWKPGKRVRLIVGGAEETTWECMEHYLAKEQEPTAAFSPDCDFPVVNCEKGIIRGVLRKRVRSEESGFIELNSEESYDNMLHRLKVRVASSQISPGFNLTEGALEKTYETKRVQSRNPHRSVNAAFSMQEELKQLYPHNDEIDMISGFIRKWFPDEPYGENIGISHTDEETGRLTMALCHLNYKDGELGAGFDIRYPNGVDEDSLLDRLKVKAEKDGMELDIVKVRRRLYHSPASELVSKLLDAYESVTGERHYPVTKGGASYSRALKNCVGFGPTFPGEIPNSHEPNEKIDLQSFWKALEIYFEAIMRLSSD